MAQTTGLLAFYLTIAIVLSQNTQWTGYGDIDDVLQLPVDTSFRIRHIGGQSLYRNSGWSNHDIHGSCSIDSTNTARSYYTLNQLSIYTEYCGQTWPAYQFTNVYDNDMIGMCANSCCPAYSEYWMDQGCHNEEWLTSDCLGITKVVSPYRKDRYYTQLLHPFYVSNNGYGQSVGPYRRCPNIDRCYEDSRGPEIYADSASCGLTSYQHSLFTFEVNDAPDFSINNNKGPTSYYEGYSYLTDLNDGDIVLIRMISGAYLFDKTADTTTDNIFGRCYVAYDNQRWKIGITSGYYTFLNAKSGKYLCRDPTLIGGNSYALIVDSTLSQDCYFIGTKTEDYGDRGYTYLYLRKPSSGEQLCVDTDPSQVDQCDETQNIVLKETCGIDSGLVYFEKPI